MTAMAALRMRAIPLPDAPTLRLHATTMMPAHLIFAPEANVSTRPSPAQITMPVQMMFAILPPDAYSQL